MTRSAIVIPPDAKFITGVQAYSSNRWPMSKATFYKMIDKGIIKGVEPYPGARPVFSVEQIDGVFLGESGD